MTDGELLAYMGDDASKWAAEFCKIARDKGHDLDEGWMIGWFANAIEHSSDLRQRNARNAMARRLRVVSAKLGYTAHSDPKNEAQQDLLRLIHDLER